MKKILACILAVMMIASMSVAAVAADETGITVGSTDGAHTYVAYQIFAGDYHDGVLSNLVWGSGITSAGQTAVQGLYSVADAASVASLLVTEQDAKDFAKKVAPYLTSGTTLSNTEFNALTPGYYLVKENSDIQGTNHAATTFILHVAGHITLSPKASVPTMDKKQSTTGADYTHDPLDVGMSDLVYYELTGTLPSTLDTYDTYKYVFHDTLSSGLTFNDGSVKVEIDGVNVTSAFTVTHDNGTLTIGIDNIKGISGVTVTHSSKVAVYYTATLNQNAVVGNPGNPNTAKLEFSNDPTWDGEGTTPTGETPEVKVVVFTFKIKGNKQDNVDDSKHLKDAKFILKNADKSKFAVLNEDNKITGWTDVRAEATEIVSDANGDFNFIGLDVGTYYLEETVAPAGYNKLAEDVMIKITASYDGQALSGLTAEVGSVQIHGDPATGSMSIVVRNSAGTTLPSTGGVGTTLFYVFGSLLAVSAVVLLVTKKRMSVK